MCYLLAAITLTARWRREGDKRMRCCGCSSLCCRIQTWPRRDWRRHDIGSKQKARRRVCWEMRFWKKQTKKKQNSKSQLLTRGRRRSSFKLDYSCADAAACVSLHHVAEPDWKWSFLKPPANQPCVVQFKQNLERFLSARVLIPTEQPHSGRESLSTSSVDVNP